MNFTEFVEKSCAEKSVFDRRQFDFSTNLVKWLAYRLAYFFYKLNFSANFLDVGFLFMAFLAYWMIFTITFDNQILPLLGVGIIYFHVLLDFIDGPIAKARGECSNIGKHLDDIGCDLNRVVMLILFGMLAGKPQFILANAFAGIVIVYFIPPTRQDLLDYAKGGSFVRWMTHRYSLIGVRFMLFLLPLLLLGVFYSGLNTVFFVQVVSVAYISLAVLWVLLCLTVNREKGVSP